MGLPSHFLKPSPRALRILLAIGVIGGALGLFALNARAPRELTRVEALILQVTAPAQAMVASVYRWGQDRVGDYIALVDVRRENLRLQEEVRVLRERIHSAREADLENRRLRRLLNLGERVRLSYRPARVIAYDPMSQYRTIRIDRGTEGGVLRGQAVVTDEGVVGRVLRAWAHHADVILITDTRSAVDSFIQRNRAQGVVEGTGQGACRMKYLLRGSDVREGDVIVTSGFDGLFPRGLAIGIVRGGEPRGFGVSQETEVIPFVDLSRVEEVLVLDAGRGLFDSEGWLGEEMP